VSTITMSPSRHVPVVKEGRLAGIVSIGDVVKSRMSELEFEREQLDSYAHSDQSRPWPPGFSPHRAGHSRLGSVVRPRAPARRAVHLASAARPTPATATVDGLGDHRVAAVTRSGGLLRCGSDPAADPKVVAASGPAAKASSIAGTNAAMS
jgi:hypothetical protein